MLDIEESDLEIMKKAAKENDYLGMNYYQSRFIQAYDGENDIYHNGTGEKGTSRFRLKGVGERMNKEGMKGAKSVFDVPLSYLSAKSNLELMRDLL